MLKRSIISSIRPPLLCLEESMLFTFCKCYGNISASCEYSLIYLPFCCSKHATAYFHAIIINRNLIATRAWYSEIKPKCSSHKTDFSVIYCREKANLSVTLSTSGDEVLAHASFSDHPMEELVDEACWENLFHKLNSGQKFTVCKLNMMSINICSDIHLTGILISSSLWTLSSCICLWPSPASL